MLKLLSHIFISTLFSIDYVAAESDDNQPTMESTTVNYMQQIESTSGENSVQLSNDMFHQQMATVASVGTEQMSNIASCSGRLQSIFVAHNSQLLFVNPLQHSVEPSNMQQGVKEQNVLGNFGNSVHLQPQPHSYFINKRDNFGQQMTFIQNSNVGLKQIQSGLLNQAFKNNIPEGSAITHTLTSEHTEHPQGLVYSADKIDYALTPPNPSYHRC